MLSSYDVRLELGVAGRPVGLVGDRILGRHNGGLLNRADAAGALNAVRTFSFPGRERVMQDSMREADGVLVDRPGWRR